MDKAWAATARAETWKTAGSSSPDILNMLGIMSSRPWEAVKVVVRAPLAREPCTAPAAPASDCISRMERTWPQAFFRPCAAQSSHTSPMVEEGVIG